jgi:hypothetical protein
MAVGQIGPILGGQMAVLWGKEQFRNGESFIAAFFDVIMAVPWTSAASSSSSSSSSIVVVVLLRILVAAKVFIYFILIIALQSLFSTIRRSIIQID